MTRGFLISASALIVGAAMSGAAFAADAHSAAVVNIAGAQVGNGLALTGGRQASSVADRDATIAKDSGAKDSGAKTSTTVTAALTIPAIGASGSGNDITFTTNGGGGSSPTARVLTSAYDNGGLSAAHDASSPLATGTIASQ